LLQSCPYLVLVLVPVADALRNGRGRRRVLMLGLAPALLVGLYCFFGWDGGLSLNQRYFVPALPMLVVLAAAAFERLALEAGPRKWSLAVVAAVSGLGFLAIARVAGVDFLGQSLLVLTLPLALAGTLLATLVPTLGRSPRPRWSSAALLLGVAGAAWAVMTACAYDLPRTMARRALYAGLAAATLERVEGGQWMLFSEPVELVATAADRRPVPLANPGMDDYATFLPLVRRALSDGREVYAAVGLLRLDNLRSRGVLDALELEPVIASGGALVARVRAVDPARGESRGSSDDGD